jgi:hypothetical protein
MRNALILLLNTPLQSLGLGLLCLALLLVSVGVVFPLFMATPAIIAVACNVALLACAGVRPPHAGRPGRK